MQYRRRQHASARSWWRWAADAAAVAALAALILHAVDRFAPVSWVAGVSVVDGDSLRREGEDIRLHGIDAPELGQRCRDGRDRAYDCGGEAKAALKQLIGRSDVECRIGDEDRYGRGIATCYAGGLELNREMVRRGWAIAYLRHTQVYLAAAREARAARRGLWQGGFELPEDFRAGRDGHPRGRRGAVGGDRTLDLPLTKGVLYH